MSRVHSQRAECVSAVEKRVFRLPPSGFRPIALAIASSKVDLPVPFSPIKNVTLGWNVSESRLATARSEERRVGKERACRHTRSLCDWSADVCSSDLYEPRALPKSGMRVSSRKESISITAFRIQTHRIGYSFKQGRLAGAVLADKKRHFGVECQRVEVGDGEIGRAHV